MAARPLMALCHFCELHGPRVVFTTEVRMGSPDAAADGAGADRPADECEGCTSVASSSEGFCSQDSEDAARWYCSQQLPNDPDQSSQLRQACTRSLSCEVFPSPEAVIYFGDDVRGHVVAHNFSLSDVYARGSQRKYSIVVLSSEKHRLLRNWTFFSQQLRQIAQDLQTNAERVFEVEEPATLEDFPLFVQERRGRRRDSASVKPSRSLPELTDTPAVFISLHQLFTFVLRAGESRFVQQASGMNVPTPARTALQPPPITTNLSGLLGRRLRQLRGQLTAERFCDVIGHVVVGHQLVLRGREQHVTAIIEAFRILLPPSCYTPLPYSTCYQPPHRCNLLGVPAAAPLPQQLPKSVIVVRLEDAEPPRCATVEAMTARPGPPPTLVQQVEAALGAAHLPDCILDHRLSALRLDWKSKSDQLFRFWSWEGGDGGRTHADTRAFTDALGCRPCDLPLLQFWMTTS